MTSCISSPVQDVASRFGNADRAAACLLEQHDVDWRAQLEPDSPDAFVRDVLATQLMDLYRRTASTEAFEALVAVSYELLARRVRARTRYLGERVDPDELLQDAFINIFRYPDKFDATRPGAFRAWASTIVDNAIRRHVRRSRSGVDVRLHPMEILAQEPDRHSREPGAVACDNETRRRIGSAFCMLLQLYIRAYAMLSERERFVLQMVEVNGLRYAELAEALEMRPEALKMVVFRARRRIFERIAKMMLPAGAEAA